MAKTSKNSSSSNKVNKAKSIKPKKDKKSETKKVSSKLYGKTSIPVKKSLKKDVSSVYGSSSANRDTDFEP